MPRWNPGTPPTLRFPTAQSPMPSFNLVVPESRQPVSPTLYYSPRWRTSMFQAALPTVSLPERANAHGILSRPPNLEQVACGRKQWLGRNLGTALYGNPLTRSQAQPLVQRPSMATQVPSIDQLENLSATVDNTQRSLNQAPVSFQSSSSFAQPLSRRRSALITQCPTTRQPQTSSTIVDNNRSNFNQPSIGFQSGSLTFAQPPSQRPSTLITQGATSVYNTSGNLLTRPPVNFQSGTSRITIAQPLARRPITFIPDPQTSSAIVNNRWSNLNQQPISLRSPTPYPKSRSETIAEPSTSQLPLELEVGFGGDRHPLGWNTLRPSVERLIEKLADIYNNNNSLTITWHPSSPDVDLNGWRGGIIFKSLFDRLSREIKPGRTALTSFKRLSINVSAALGHLDIMPITGLERTNEEDDKIDEDKIDLSPASNVKELLLRGSHMFFSEKLSNLPGQSLTLLSVTCCKISVNDTFVLLQVCPQLQDATFATVSAESACELGNQYTPKSGVELRCELQKFTITSSVDITLILKSLGWQVSPIITINILDDAVAGQEWGPYFDCLPINTTLTMNGNFSQGAKASIREYIPDVVFRR